LQVQQTGPSEFVAEFLGSIDSEPCLVAYVQPASACYETVVTRLGCIAFAVDQGPTKVFFRILTPARGGGGGYLSRKERLAVIELPVVFVEPVPVNLVAEEVCSTGKYGFSKQMNGPAYRMDVIRVNK
jgi:hypothetical protein